MWLKTSFNLVNNGVIAIKKLVSKGSLNFRTLLLKIFKLSECRIFQIFEFVPFDNGRMEKGKKDIS